MNGWEGYPWPKWIPKEVRAQIEDFWGSHQGRTSLDWCRNSYETGSKIPPLGALVSVPANDSRPHGRRRRGRWVHCWNNIGRVVLPDGKWMYSSTCFLKRVS